MFHGEPLYIPFVGAIIEREADGKKQILVQIRDKKDDPIYSQSFEIPGGKFRAFEDVYETLRREVKEECGLDITAIARENERVNFQSRDHTSSLIEPFCVTQMREGPFIGLIFLCQAKGKPLQETEETKEARWMDIEKLRSIIDNTPEKIYTAFLAPLKKYLQEK